MCIIVDSNRLGTFLRPGDEDSAPIHNWLKKNGKLIYSTEGKFRSEIGQKAKSKLREHSRAGRAKHIPHTRLVTEERELRGQTALQSDDIHILALARYTGARLLYTGDENLKQDFKNTEIIKPKGKIYSGKEHANLLNRSKCRTLKE